MEISSYKKKSKEVGGKALRNCLGVYIVYGSLKLVGNDVTLSQVKAM